MVMTGASVDALQYVYYFLDHCFHVIYMVFDPAYRVVIVLVFPRDTIRHGFVDVLVCGYFVRFLVSVTDQDVPFDLGGAVLIGGGATLNRANGANGVVDTLGYDVLSEAVLRYDRFIGAFADLSGGAASLARDGCV